MRLLEFRPFFVPKQYTFSKQKNLKGFPQILPVTVERPYGGDLLLAGGRSMSIGDPIMGSPLQPLRRERFKNLGLVL